MNTVKVERVHAPQGGALFVELYLDKDSGKFFATLAGERICAATKSAAIQAIHKALRSISEVQWRGVILLRTNKKPERERDEATSYENGRPVFSAGCNFSYCRRERATDPLHPKKQIERDHPVDFEKMIERRRRVVGQGGYGGVERKKRFDQEEAAMREKRAIHAGVEAPYDWGYAEHEIPYTQAAWDGIERIAQALRETQAKLDFYTKHATGESLALLSSSGVAPLLLLPADLNEAPTGSSKGKGPR